MHQDVTAALEAIYRQLLSYGVTLRENAFLSEKGSIYRRAACALHDISNCVLLISPLSNIDRVRATESVEDSGNDDMFSAVHQLARDMFQNLPMERLESHGEELAQAHELARRLKPILISIHRANRLAK